MSQNNLFSGNISLCGFKYLLVAFSGGMDSTVLLYAVAALRQQQDITVRAVHIHHGLSLNADHWAAHCEAVCRSLEIPLTVERVTLTRNGQGIEASARQARYQVFSDLLEQDEALLTAHHQDDQCETLLLALKRGSGPAGLSAMPEILPFAKGAILRPLLSCTRRQLTEYAEAKQLRWIEDESNEDASYDRNFLRLTILPLLEQRWPHFSSAVARSAELCGEQEALLDELLQHELNILITPQHTLPVAPLSGMSPQKRAAMLRRWLARCGAVMPSRSQLSQIWTDVACSREDANPRLVAGNGEIRRYDNHLWWVTPAKDYRQTSLVWADFRQPLVLPDALGCLQSAAEGIPLRLPEKGEKLSVRFTAQGHLHIVGRDRGRELKKIWQENRIPPWQRQSTPILYYDDQPICAPGVFVCKQGVPDNHCWHLQWLREK